MTSELVLPEFIRIFPELAPDYAETQRLKAEIAKLDADVLQRAYDDPRVDWGMFVRGVVEVGKFPPSDIAMVTGAMGHSVLQWLAGKGQPIDEVKPVYAAKLIEAVRQRH